MTTKMQKPPKKSKTFCTMCPKWEIKKPEICSNTLISKNKKHYFCTRRCKERFIKKAELVS